ncbi:unnamed protein product [Lota lota]
MSRYGNVMNSGNAAEVKPRLVVVLINRGAVRQDCTVINWAQDLICSVLMKMKRGSGVVLREQRGGYAPWQPGRLMKRPSHQPDC